MFLILFLPFFPLMYLRRKKEEVKKKDKREVEGKNKTNKKKFSSNKTNPCLCRLNALYLLA